MILLADANLNPISGPITTLTPDAAGASNLVNTILGFFTILGGLWFLFWVIIAAFNWIAAEGKPDKLEKARTQVIQAITGLIILIAAYALTALIGAIMQIDFFDLVPFF